MEGVMSGSSSVFGASGHLPPWTRFRQCLREDEALLRPPPRVYRVVMRDFRAAVLQLNSGSDEDANLRRAEELVEQRENSAKNLEKETQRRLEHAEEKDKQLSSLLTQQKNQTSGIKFTAPVILRILILIG